MALRIIRKSASQSHVELIKGTQEKADKPLISLLVYLQNQEDLESFKQLFYQEDSWLHQHCEVILMKSKAITTSVRSQLTAMPFTIKLLTEPEKLSPSKRVHILVQEASAPYCIYFSQAPQSFSDTCLETIVQRFNSDPTVGALGMAWQEDNKIMCGGYSFSSEAYKLRVNGDVCDINATSGEAHHLFAQLPSSSWSKLTFDTLNITALPLNGLALRKSAYQASQWQDSNWPDNWVALDLCLKMHQAQYWVQLLPLTVQFTSQNGWGLESLMEEKEQFLEQWQQSLYDDHRSVYSQAGFQKTQANTFELLSLETEQDKIQAYLEQLSS